jgi:hypothetical protein
MILSLTAAFQLRLRLGWKPELKGFLIGERNLFFFTPETLVEAAQIDVASIDSFLSSNSIGGRWELLGFLTPEELPAFPGYAQVSTHRESDPTKWKAKIYLMGENEPELFPLEVRIAGLRHLKSEA